MTITATDLKTMTIAYQGQPFVQITTGDIDTYELDTAYLGTPFIGAADPIVVPIVPEVTVGGGIGHGKGKGKKRPSLVIVEIDGVEFKVPYDQLASFIAAQKKIIKAENRRIAQKARKKGQEPPPQELPSVVILDAPREYLPIIKEAIDNRNEIYYKLWQASLLEFIRRMDDEAIMVLIAEEYANIASMILHEA